MPVLEQPPRSPHCRCKLGLDGDPLPSSRCGYHAVDFAEVEAVSAAVAAYMRETVKMDPFDPANDDTVNWVSLMLQPALDAYLDAFFAITGYTLTDVRTFLKEHPRG